MTIIMSGCKTSRNLEFFNGRKPNTVSKIQFKRRVLYDKYSREFPANYIDKTFLLGLQKNVNMKTYDLINAITNTTVVTEELNSISTILSSFHFLDNQLLPQCSFFLLSSILVMFFYIIFEYEWCFNSVYEHLKRCFMYLAFILGLSPVLKTLTDTVSTDSIYFMSIMLMIIHLLTLDYGLSISIVAPSLSLTAAIAASVTLASRLPTTVSVFEFLTFAVEVIALFPILRKKVRTQWPKSRIYLTCIIIFIGATSAWFTSPIFAVILFILDVFINLFCPILFIRWQKYKDNIYGPWDEATISNNYRMRKIE